MNFAPSSPDRVLHDTWVFIHGDEIHLFYLAILAGNNQHRFIGHAVSHDWLHWRELPYIDLAGPEGAWDSGRVGTGHTFQGCDGRFYMAYTGRIDPQEDVGLAVSDDLLNWRKVSDTPVWPQALTAPYETDFRERGIPQAWRDPFVTVLPNGQRVALLCAKRSDGPLAARACVAMARLGDLAQWTTLPPLRTPPLFPTMEVPEVFEMDGRWWLTFNANGGWGRRLDTPSRDITGGTYYLVADDPLGEWRMPEDCLLIGSGQGRRDAVVARSVIFGGERLVYHHYTGSGEADSPRALGLPKVLETAGNRLVLRPWRGLAAIHREISIGNWTAPTAGPFSSGTWATDGTLWTGRCPHGAAIATAPASTSDLDVTYDIHLRDAERAGIGVAGDRDGQSAALVLLDAKRGQIALCELRPGAFGPVLDPPLDLAHRSLQADATCRLRILKRSRYLEVFLDDELVFSTIWARPSAGQNLVAVVEGGSAAVQLQAAHGLARTIRALCRESA